MRDLDRRERNQRAITEFMEAIGMRDFDALASICTEDFVAELPYSDPPARFAGFEAYRAGVAPKLEVFHFTLSTTQIHLGLEPDLIVAEYAGEGTAIPTGKPYRNVYIGVWRFAGGKVASLREFYDPLVAGRALDPD